MAERNLCFDHHANVQPDEQLARLSQLSEEQIPIGNEVIVHDTDDQRETISTDSIVTRDILADNEHLSFQNTSSDKLYLLHDDDADVAAQIGLIRRIRVNRTPVVPDRKAMKVLLRHIYDVTGEIYDDIPPKYRTSHLSLALYLKLSLRCPSSKDTYNTSCDLETSIPIDRV